MITTNDLTLHNLVLLKMQSQDLSDCSDLDLIAKYDETLATFQTTYNDYFSKKSQDGQQASYSMKRPC